MQPCGSVGWELNYVDAGKRGIAAAGNPIRDVHQTSSALRLLGIYTKRQRYPADTNAPAISGKRHGRI